MLKGKKQVGKTYKPITNAIKGGGLVRSSEEAFVMEVEQRD